MPETSLFEGRAKPKLLFLGEIETAHQIWKDLERVANVQVVVLLPLCGAAAYSGTQQLKHTTPKQFLESCKTDAFADINVIVRTFDSTQETGRFDETLVKALPPSVKYICHIGAGYDSIDAVSCSKQGIAVSNTPNVVNKSTATLTMSLILICCRRLQFFRKALHDGHWRGIMRFGFDPQGLTLGILGKGGIGTEVAKLASAFEMRIQYHNRTPLPEKKNPTGARYVDLEQLLETSDVISVHTPLNNSTRHIIGASEIWKMKKGAVLVNTSRGSVIDESALLDALDRDHLSCAGLDVFENEPDVTDALRQHAKCVLTPHIGSATFETQRAMEILAAQNAEMAISYGKLRTPVAESIKLEEQKAMKTSKCRGERIR